ncbi:MAG: polysaccharide deacetylase family protein [Clostridia bacterium]|nr:polysaccharide deacetylase family protein [Clostridia bacterium]
MKFSRWIITFIIASVMTAILLCGFNFIVDPFGVFGDKFLKWYSYDMVNNPRAAKIAYLDQFHDKYDSYIIGGSKSSSINPALLNKYYGNARFYSMMMYGGDFYDYEKTLYYLVDNYKVKNIIVHMSLHEISHYHLKSDEIKQSLHAKVEGEPLSGFYFKYLTLNPTYGFTKLEGLAKRAIDSFEYSQIKPEEGVYNKVKRDAEKIDDLEEYLKNNSSFSKPQAKLTAGAMDMNVASLKRMKDYCEKRNITFKFIAGATYQAEMQRYNLEDLKKYWRKLVQVTDFWDFSGYTSISYDPRYFYDPTHYRNSVGRMMTAYMFGDKDVYVPENFGHYTTKANVDEHINKVFAASAQKAGKAKGEKKVPIITYHHIDTDASKLNSVVISPQKFKSDMLALKQAGYETVFLKDLDDYVNNIKELPAKPVVITFDDGYLSNYMYAYPVLKELDMKATIAVIGWSVGKTKYKNTDKPINPHFTWEQGREMYESGHIDIQNHTFDLHEPNETEYPYRRGVLQKKDELDGPYSIVLKQDCLKMNNLIEANVGNKVIALTYPFGAFSHLSEQVMYELGYKLTLTTKPGINRIKKGDPQSLFELKRINASYELPSKDLVDKLDD